MGGHGLPFLRPSKRPGSTLLRQLRVAAERVRSAVLAATPRIPAGQRFCNACGEPLTAGAWGPPGAAGAAAIQPPDHLADKIRAGGSALEGERKQVTVLFADVMGSMELAEGSDPEEWRQVMDRFFAILCDGVHQFEGTVDKFTGDGIMALFGAPIAHEDHAQRACFAALHLIDDAGRVRGRAAADAGGSTSWSGWASTPARWWSGGSARTWEWSTRRSATPSASPSAWSSSPSRARPI